MLFGFPPRLVLHKHSDHLLVAGVRSLHIENHIDELDQSLLVVVFLHFPHELQKGLKLQHSFSWLLDLSQTLQHNLLNELWTDPQNHRQSFLKALPIEGACLTIIAKQSVMRTEQAVDFVAAHRGLRLQLLNVPLHEGVFRVESLCHPRHLFE